MASSLQWEHQRQDRERDFFFFLAWNRVPYQEMTPSWNQVHNIKEPVLSSDLLYGSGPETPIADALSFLHDGPFLL